MTRKYLLEISVDGLGRALAAERGGADRIELSVDLSVGGLTPSRELLQSVREKVHLDIYSMIRPRAGDFVYASSEFAAMKRSIAQAKDRGMDGVVLGILRRDYQVDVERTQELVELARPLPVTFHRAFDECADLRESLESVIRAGATRILTSGGASGASEGAAVLAGLVRLARGRITILPGGGISASNIADLARRTHAREFHSGLSSALPYSSSDFRTFEAEVRKLAGRYTVASGE
jgi:copper homeostasis protein